MFNEPATKPGLRVQAEPYSPLQPTLVETARKGDHSVHHYGVRRIACGPDSVRDRCRKFCRNGLNGNPAKQHPNSPGQKSKCRNPGPERRGVDAKVWSLMRIS